MVFPYGMANTCIYLCDYRYVHNYLTGSEKTRYIVNSMKFELAVLLNSSTIEQTFLQVYYVLRFGARALHATPTKDEKLWSKGVAMHACSVSVYYT